MKKAADIEKTIVVKEHDWARYETRQCFMKIVFGIGGQMA